MSLFDLCAPPRNRRHHHRGCGCHECKPPQDCHQPRECKPKHSCDD